MNNVSINIFGLEFKKQSKRNTVVGPLYFTKSKKSKRINLLYINNGVSGHYCYIKNLSRLVRKQINSRHVAVQVCDGCLVHFSEIERLKTIKK